MTFKNRRWALVGAGLGLVASVSAAAIFFVDEHDRAPAGGAH